MTRLTLAKLVWNFDMAFAPEVNRDWDDQKQYLSPERGPLLVSLTPYTPKAVF